MATILENQASLSYLYDGITDTLSATSNVASTTLNDACSATVTKTPLSATFRNGDNISYILRIENTGSAGLGSVTIVDDLAAGGLVYQANSLNVYVDSTAVTVTPTVVGSSLQFSLPVNLASGEVAFAVYTAKVNSLADALTNTATVTATGLNPAACSLTETAASTITASGFADLSIYKNSSATTVNSGDELSYSFTVLNSGNIDATNVVLTDDLPDEFEVTSVSVTTDGVTTVYSSADYTLDTSTNTITLPNASGAQITVPAATAQGPGITTVTITGRVL